MTADSCFSPSNSPSLIHIVMNMEEVDAAVPRAFDKLFAKSVPHILERIFLSLDYDSFKSCLEVSKVWHNLLKYESIQKRAKYFFRKEISRDETNLWNECFWGNRSAVKRLLSTGLLDTNCVRGILESTPLCEAVTKRHNQVVQLLLDAGVDPNAKGKVRETTPLHEAAIHGRKEATQMLLDSGAEPNSVDDFEQTPLMLATEWCHLEVAKVLLNRGSDPNKADKYGMTPLLKAAQVGRDVAVKMLLEGGADPDKAGNDGHTPLYWAAWNGHKKVVQLLIRGGADPNKTKKEEWPSMPGLSHHVKKAQLLLDLMEGQWADPKKTE